MSQITTILPLYDRVLCQRVIAPHTTEGGLVIPEAARERPQEATVIAVGCGKATGYSRDVTPVGSFIGMHETIYHKPIVKPGDTILIGKYAGAEVSVGAQNYLIVREDEILGIVNTVEAPAPAGEEIA